MNNVNNYKLIIPTIATKMKASMSAIQFATTNESSALTITLNRI